MQVLSKAQNVQPAAMLHAFARAVHLSRHAQSEVLDTVYRLHASRLKLLAHVAPPTLLAALCAPHLEGLSCQSADGAVVGDGACIVDDACIVAALLQALVQWLENAGGNRCVPPGVAAAAEVAAAHCFLPEVARALHGAGAGVGEVRSLAVADLDAT